MKDSNGHNILHYMDNEYYSLSSLSSAIGMINGVYITGVLCKSTTL